jgi:hypothetical protein
LPCFDGFPQQFTDGPRAADREHAVFRKAGAPADATEECAKSRAAGCNPGRSVISAKAESHIRACSGGRNGSQFPRQRRCGSSLEAASGMISHIRKRVSMYQAGIYRSHKSKLPGFPHGMAGLPGKQPASPAWTIASLCWEPVWLRHPWCCCHTGHSRQRRQ